MRWLDTASLMFTNTPRWIIFILKRPLYRNKYCVLYLFIFSIVLYYYCRPVLHHPVTNYTKISVDELDRFLIGDLNSTFTTEKADFNHNATGDLKCNQPQLDPYHPSVNQYFYKVPKLQCGAEKDWVYVFNGSLYFSSSEVDVKGIIWCDYIPIVRVDDFSNKDGAPIKNFPNGTRIISDFCRVECHSANGDEYSKVLAGTAYNRRLHEKPAEEFTRRDAITLSVLMFGFDSVSRMTAIRKYVNTRDYILNHLHGFELEGYNIVGDGTPQALLPILTGKNEFELPEARRGVEGAQPVDGHPFIWKEFKKAGYVTMWAEDSPKIGIFEHRMLGLVDSPTDHYLRPYYLASEFRHEQWFKFARDYINSIWGFFSGKTLIDPAFCYGSKPKHQIFIDYLGDAFDMYPSKNKFIFGFHSEITHDSNNDIDLIDDDVVLFLKRLENRGYLNNTLLIFMSDHGARFETVRQTVQGKLEERMPFFTFRFPPWFEQMYPEAMNNFKLNTKRLTTPFDIHATFEHMLKYTGTGLGDVWQRGISLFKEIPKERSCDHAGVEPHWCACLEWQDVDHSDLDLKRAIIVAISTINNITEQYRSYCHFLRISKITRAKKYFANADVLRFKQSADHDGRVADLSSKTKNNEIFFQLTFITQPGNGHFEITVRHILNTNEMISSLKDISRTNAYGRDANCIADTYPHLERFCYCK